MNKKSLIFSGIVAVLSLLSVILLFVPMFNLSTSDDVTEKYSMFALGQLLVKEAAEMASQPEAASMAIIFKLPSISAIVMLVLNASIFVLAVLSILTACNVIKSTKAAKAFGIVAVILASFSIVGGLVLAGMFVMVTMSIMQAINAAPIVIPVIAIALVVFTAINLHVVKKAAKQIA